MTHFTTPGGPNYNRMFREFSRWYRSWRQSRNARTEQHRLALQVDLMSGKSTD